MILKHSTDLYFARRFLVWIFLLGLLPELNAALYNVRDFGAVGNLKVMDTRSIQKAIDQCHAEGGGTVVLPSGFEFLSGTLVLKSNVTIEVQKGAMLRGSRDLADYNKTVPDIESYTVINYSDYALIQAIGVDNVGIKGRGIIDGDGVAVPGRTGSGNYKMRPYLLRFIHCSNVQIRDVMLKNPNFWTQLYLEIDNLHIDGVVVRSMNLNPHQPNGDGVDIDGCQNVLIENMDIHCEDDGIVLKSTTMRPMKNVLIRNNTVKSNVNAIKIGTETHGEIRDVEFRNNRVIFSGRAALTVQCVDGAHIENITFEDIVIDEAAVPIFLRLGDRGRRILPDSDAPGVGMMRNITFRNIVSKDVKAALPPKEMPRSVGSAFSGIKGHTIENIVLENLDLTYAGGITDYKSAASDVPENVDKYPNPHMFGELPAYAFYFRHVTGVKMKNVNIRYLKKDCRSAIIFDNVYNVDMEQLYVQHDKDAAPVAEFVHGYEGSKVDVTFINALNRYQINGHIPANSKEIKQ